MRIAISLVFLLAACGSSQKPAAPVNHVDHVEPASAPPPNRDDELVKAQREADDAVKAMRELQDKLEKLSHDLEDLDRKVNAAVDAVVAAQSDADRATAKAKLEQLRKDKAELDAKIRDAKAAAEKAAREKGRKISQECIDNPLAKGCS